MYRFFIIFSTHMPGAPIYLFYIKKKLHRTIIRHTAGTNLNFRSHSPLVSIGFNAFSGEYELKRQIHKSLFFTTDFIVVILNVCSLVVVPLTWESLYGERKYCTQTSESTKEYFHLKLIAISYIWVWGKGGREDARSQDKYTTQLQTNIIKVLPRER